MKLKFRFPGRLRLARKRKNTPISPFYYPETDELTWISQFWNEYKFAIIVLVVALVIILTNALSYAQSPDNKAVHKGQPVPDVPIGKTIGFTGPETKISDFRGKLLILDFWDTWCGACVKALPRLDSLQRRFGNKICILPVTDQKGDQIRSFLKTFYHLQAMTSVVEDHKLASLFPHRLLSHEVWISPDGKLLGTTYVDMVTDQYINLVLQGKRPDWAEKEDEQPVDTTQTLFARELLDRVPDNAPVFTECLTGHLKGLPPTSKILHHDSTTTYFYINDVLLHLYTIAFNSALPITARRRILDVPNPEDFVTPKQYRSKWSENHTFSYEATVPNHVSEKEVLQALKSKLDSWTGLEGRISPREVECLILRKMPGAPGIRATRYAGKKAEEINPGHLALHAISAANLAYTIDHQPGSPLVFDESGVQERFDLESPGCPTTPEGWNNLLRPLGLELVSEKRSVDFFILSKPGHQIPDSPSTKP